MLRGDEAGAEPTWPATSRRWSPRSRAATWPGCGWSSTAPTAPRRYVAPPVLDQLGGRAVGSSTPSPTGATSTRDAARPIPVICRRRWWRPEPIWGWPSTVTPTGCVAVDEQGELVDGDHLLALCAVDLRQRGQLTDDAVVVTVMTNLGFRIAMADQGIEVVETQVGDRYVLEALEARGLALGGEQSGHVIFRRLATTGDGLLTGVQLLDLVARSGRPLSELAAAAMTRLPQVLTSVAVARVGDGDGAVALIADEIAAVEAELGTSGRVLVRSSGTEALVRVMVEAIDPAEARRRGRPPGGGPAWPDRRRRLNPPGRARRARIGGVCMGRARGRRPLSWFDRPGRSGSPDRWIRGSDRAAWPGASPEEGAHPMCGIIAVVRRPSERPPPLAGRDHRRPQRRPPPAGPAGRRPGRPPAHWMRWRPPSPRWTDSSAGAPGMAALAGDPALMSEVTHLARVLDGDVSAHRGRVGLGGGRPGAARRRRRHRGRQRRAGRPEGRGVGHRARPGAHRRRGATRWPGPTPRPPPCAATCPSSRRSPPSIVWRCGDGTRPGCTCWCAATSWTCEPARWRPSWPPAAPIRSSAAGRSTWPKAIWASSTRPRPRSASWATTPGRCARPSRRTGCCAGRCRRRRPRPRCWATPAGPASGSSPRPTPTRSTPRSWPPPSTGSAPDRAGPTGPGPARRPRPT